MEIENKLNPDLVPYELEAIWKNKYQYVVAGINEDDCAVLKIGDSDLVITSDFLNASPISIELGIATNFDLGRLLVASNISDLCGSGAKPMAMMLCTMMDRRTSNSEYLELIEGVKFELNKIDIPLIGGDTKLGKSTALLGTAIGIREKGAQLFLKNGASANEIIWVSGEIGSVSGSVDGLVNLKNDLSSDWIHWATQRLIDPQLPIEKSKIVALSGVGKGGTDLSDGLGANLKGLCLASQIGCVIDVNKVPVNPRIYELSKIKNVTAWNYAFIIGGDFQFIVTTNSNDREFMEKEGFIEIGFTTENKDCKIQINENYYELPLNGHEDARKLSFGEEVSFLLSKLKYLK